MEIVSFYSFFNLKNWEFLEIYSFYSFLIWKIGSFLGKTWKNMSIKMTIICKKVLSESGNFPIWLWCRLVKMMIIPWKVRFSRWRRKKPKVPKKTKKLQVELEKIHSICAMRMRLKAKNWKIWREKPWWKMFWRKNRRSNRFLLTIIMFFY